MYSIYSRFELCVRTMCEANTLVLSNSDGMHRLGASANAPYIGVIYQIMLALHSAVELVYVPHIGGTQ